MKAKIIESTWKFSPEILKLFIIKTIEGSVSQLRQLIDQYHLSSEDICLMRGVDCKAFVEIKTASELVKRNIILDTNMWNPVHFATFYKQQKVLQFFMEHFGNDFDIRFAMKYKEADIESYEGVVQKKYDQHKLN